MAFLYPDDGLLTKAESSHLTYPQLAALKQRAMHGDASANIALTQLPPGTQRLAEMLVDTFGNTIAKSAKPKKPKTVTKAIKQATGKKALRASLEYTAANGDSLAEREGAREALRAL